MLQKKILKTVQQFGILHLVIILLICQHVTWSEQQKAVSFKSSRLPLTRLHLWLCAMEK